jgi:hypothetical protein
MILGRRNALCLAIATLLGTGRHAARAQGARLPDRWHVGDPPPEVEGIRLGDTRERVVAVLGAPEPNLLPDDPAADLQTLRYRHGALMVAISRTDGVARILLNRPEGGALAGIHVGDRLGALLVSWGEPTTSTSKLGRYEMGAWTITVRADLGAQAVLKLMLARTPSQPAAAATPAAAGSPPAP